MTKQLRSASSGVNVSQASHHSAESGEAQSDIRAPHISLDAECFVQSCLSSLHANQGLN